MGLTWFWAYKLRSIKVAHRMLRDNPARAFLMSMGGGILPNIPGVSVGGPISDNFVGKAIDGGLSYSVGPGMLFEAPGLAVRSRDEMVGMKSEPVGFGCPLA